MQKKPFIFFPIFSYLCILKAHIKVAWENGSKKIYLQSNEVTLWDQEHTYDVRYSVRNREYHSSITVHRYYVCTFSGLFTNHSYFLSSFHD